MTDSPGQLPPIPFQGHFGRWIDREISPDAHLGLVFDRFAPVWIQKDGEWKAENGELKCFADSADGSKETPGAFQAAKARLDEHLKEYHARTQRLVDARGGLSGRFRTAGRLAIGLGADHPAENGFCLDPVLGVPYIPGSSLKGLCRAWAELTLVPASEIAALFGEKEEAQNDVVATSDESAPEDSDSDPSGLAGPDEAMERQRNDRAGRLIFLPAYPTKAPRVELDIVNCHLPGWYRERPGGQNIEALDRSAAIPTDSPLPVSFLTVADETPIQIHLMSRAKSAEQRESDIRRGFELLSGALQELGIGAKTAAGYGVLVPEVQNVLMWINVNSKPQRNEVREFAGTSTGRWTESPFSPLKSDPKWDGNWQTLLEKLDEMTGAEFARIPSPDSLFLHGDAPAAAFCYLGYRLAGYRGSIEVVEWRDEANHRRVRFQPAAEHLSRSSVAGFLPEHRVTAGTSYVALWISAAGSEVDLELFEGIAVQRGGTLEDFESLEVDPTQTGLDGRASVERLVASLDDALGGHDEETCYLLQVAGPESLAFAVGRALREVLSRLPRWRVLFVLEGEGGEPECLELG